MSRQGRKMNGYCAEKAVVPIEEALMAFAEADISGIENFSLEKEKGIPFISFVIKEKEGAVFIEPHPLFIADSLLKEQKTEGREILYRADYIQGSREKFATGVLFAGKKQETFLGLLKSNISSGNAKADIMGMYSYLETHLTLCGLEKLAEEEIAFMGKEEAGSADYREANCAYYKKILSYVEISRRYLNMWSSGVLLPPFPERSVFMTGWYREHGGSQ